MKNRTSKTAARRKTLAIEMVSMLATIATGLFVFNTSMPWSNRSHVSTRSESPSIVGDVQEIPSLQQTLEPVSPKPAHTAIAAKPQPQDLLVEAPGSPAPALTPPPTRSLPPPADSHAAQSEAMRRHPELGRAGSIFNREFLARVKRNMAETPAFLQDPRWPLALANEVAAAGFPSIGVDGIFANRGSMDSRLRLPSGPEWRFLKVYRQGDDIVVPSAVATVFGWDTSLGVRDPNDNGRCASGLGTLANPGLLGCALPVSLARRSTAGSPFPKVPNIPWFTPVVVTYKGKSITVPLIDNGPSAAHAGDSVPAGIDLTPAACVALGISIEDIRRNRVAFNVSFRLPSAGRQGAWD